jgi:hypothetical protein
LLPVRAASDVKDGEEMKEAGNPAEGARRLQRAGAVRGGAGLGRYAQRRLLCPLYRHRLPLRRRAAPSLFTNAFTSARSHQGEDRPSPLICGFPGLRAEGGHRAATAPPRTLMVMPAFVPGWESSLQVSPPSTPCVQPCLFVLPCLFCVLAVRAVVSQSPSRPPPWP